MASPAAPSSPPAAPPSAGQPSDSLGTTAGSETSVGFAEPCPSNIAVTVNLPIIPPSEKNVPFLDALCLALYCPTHEKLLVSSLKGGVGGGKKGLFLPTVSMRSEFESWNAVAGRFLNSILRTQKAAAVKSGASPENVVITTDLHCVDWYRVQRPKKEPLFTTRAVFVCSISSQKCYCSNTKAVSSGTDTSAPSSPVPPPHPLSSAILGASPNSLRSSVAPGSEDYWLTVEELKQTPTYRDALWGAEVVTFAEEARAYFKNKKTARNSEGDGQEWTSGMKVHEVNVEEDGLAMLTNRTGEFSKERAFLFSARYGEADIRKLLNEFIVQCFPSATMTFASFRAYMAKLGWHEEDSLLKAIFTTLVDSRTAAEKKGKEVQLKADSKTSTHLSPVLHLTFSDLLIGLSTMEERADHRGDCFLLRLKYIFHFYDEDRDGKLNRKEVDKLVGDVALKSRGNSTSNSGSVPSSGIEGNRSNEAIRQMMSSIRANPGSSINGSTNSKIAANQLVTKMLRELTGNTASITDESSISMKQFTEPVPSAIDWLAELTETLFRSNQSTVESASARFAYRLPEKTSLSVAARQVAAISRYDEPCEKCRRIGRFDLCSHGVRVDEWGAIRGTIKFNLCADYKDVFFRQEVQIEEATFDWTIHFIRYVSMINSSSGSIPQRPDRFGMKALVELVLAIFRTEPAIVRLPSPCFIIGEVRSNLEMMYRLVSTIARWYPFVNPANLVFLGNALDGNEPLAVDTAAYFLCLKALAPNRITLLRGPLEVAVVAKTGGNSQFRNDWVTSFGEATWKVFEQIIEQLPVAAVVDESLFLTKSGLPQPASLTLDAVEQKLKETSSLVKKPSDVELLLSSLL